MVCLIVLYTCFYRVLVQLHSSYQNQKDLVTWHIPSKFSQEMSTKSTVVSTYIHNIELSYLQTCLIGAPWHIP